MLFLTHWREQNHSIPRNYFGLGFYFGLFSMTDILKISKVLCLFLSPVLRFKNYSATWSLKKSNCIALEHIVTGE